MAQSNYFQDDIWAKEMADAHSFFNQWSVRFKTKTLEDYYHGFMWRNKITNTNTINYEPYQLNMFYSTIQIKLASMIFQRPEFILTPRANSQWDEEAAVQSCEIKQDALNTIITNPNIKFPKHIKKVCRDSFTQFGMIEVGYAADWRNPLKDDPQLRSDDDPDIPLEKDRILNNNEVPNNERIYVKRIQPSRFRCCVTDEWDLDSVEWYGYYQYYFRRTLQKTPGIKWPKYENYTSTSSNDYGSTAVGSTERPEDRNFLRLIANKDIVKVWHIWDNTKHERLMLLDGHFVELWSESFERRCLFDLRWEDEDGFYPAPPAFQWLSPQNEINEAREQTRSFRRRFTRKFQAVKGLIDAEEKEKFTSGPDGVIIEVKQKDALTPIQNPEQGPTAENALVLAKDDFNIISGTSSEARGQADRTTATQAKLMDARSQIRESAEQLDFSQYICLIGREILATAAEKLELEMWVKLSTTDTQPDGTVGPLYQQIKSQDLTDGYDFDIELDVTNATPQSMAASQQAYMTFLALLAQYPMILHDVDLIRETAYRVGYRNEKIIKKMQAAAVQQMQVQAAMQTGTTPNQQGGQPQPQGPNTNNAAMTQNAQMQDPSMQQIQTQIRQQLQ